MTQSLKSIEEKWDEACRREREAWALVKAIPPGRSGHEAWQIWREAVRVEDAARREFIAALDQKLR
jgi:hypothetical protein